jgi:hypothetical protein
MVGHDETLSCGRDKDAGGEGEDDWKTLENDGRRWVRASDSIAQRGGSPSEVMMPLFEDASGGHYKHSDDKRLDHKSANRYRTLSR